MRVFLLFAVLVIGCSRIFSSTILGRVVDSSGVALSEATIVIVNPSSDQDKPCCQEEDCITQTDWAGRWTYVSYHFVASAECTYSVSKDGYTIGTGSFRLCADKSPIDCYEETVETSVTLTQ
jgi:hypothetical protein